MYPMSMPITLKLGILPYGGSPAVGHYNSTAAQQPVGEVSDQMHVKYGALRARYVTSFGKLVLVNE